MRDVMGPRSDPEASRSVSHGEKLADTDQASQKPQESLSRHARRKPSLVRRITNALDEWQKLILKVAAVILAIGALIAAGAKVANMLDVHVEIGATGKPTPTTSLAHRPTASPGRGPRASPRHSSRTAPVPPPASDTAPSPHRTSPPPPPPPRSYSVESINAQESQQISGSAQYDFYRNCGVWLDRKDGKIWGVLADPANSSLGSCSAALYRSSTVTVNLATSVPGSGGERTTPISDNGTIYICVWTSDDKPATESCSSRF